MKEQLAKRWPLFATALIVLVVGAPMLFFDAYRAASFSMEPTLELDERFFVSSRAEPGRGDIIVFDAPPTTAQGVSNVVARVVAVDGDVIELLDGAVIINGGDNPDPSPVAADTWARSFPIPGCGEPEPSPDRCLVPDGHVFVMGDNRPGSQDSRTFGPVPRTSVRGVETDSVFLVLARFLP